jgi:hypothetical protein
VLADIAVVFVFGGSQLKLGLKLGEERRQRYDVKSSVTQAKFCPGGVWFLALAHVFGGAETPR